MNDRMNPDFCGVATEMMLTAVIDESALAIGETERALDLLGDVRDFLDMAQVAAEAENWTKFRSLMDEARMLIDAELA